MTLTCPQLASIADSAVLLQTLLMPCADTVVLLVAQGPEGRGNPSAHSFALCVAVLACRHMPLHLSLHLSCVSFSVCNSSRSALLCEPALLCTCSYTMHYCTVCTVCVGSLHCLR